MDQQPWYHNGLRFHCFRCGRCCTGKPGHVWVSGEEVRRLAARLETSVAAFRSRYTRRVTINGKRHTSLTEKPNYDCVFFDPAQGCVVYEDRPRQCRVWPFWRSVVASRQTWADEAENCLGMNHGRRYTAEEIQRLAAGGDGLPDSYWE